MWQLIFNWIPILYKGMTWLMVDHISGKTTCSIESKTKCKVQSPANYWQTLEMPKTTHITKFRLIWVYSPSTYYLTHGTCHLTNFIIIGHLLYIYLKLSIQSNLIIIWISKYTLLWTIYIYKRKKKKKKDLVYWLKSLFAFFFLFIFLRKKLFYFKFFYECKIYQPTNCHEYKLQRRQRKTPETTIYNCTG